MKALRLKTKQIKTTVDHLYITSFFNNDPNTKLKGG